jgi:hypothetical protein
MYGTMALKNKDGTQFRLRGPIPFMRDQQMWNEFLLHNFVFKGVTVPDSGPTEAPSVQFRLGFVEELADLTKEAEAEAKIEPTKIEEKIVLPPISEAPVQAAPPTIASMLKNSPNKCTVYCLPGNLKKNTDDLYGESRPQVVYGDPFVFEGVIVYGDDMSLSIWSPTDKVTKHSVLFPQNRDKRWWKVVGIEPNMQGWMLNTTISDYQPQFRV